MIYPAITLGATIDGNDLREQGLGIMGSDSGSQGEAPTELVEAFRFQQEGPFIEIPSGAMIMVRTVIWGVAPPDFHAFIGTTNVKVKQIDPRSGQVAQGLVPIQFSIEADDLNQAFERFHEAGEAAGRACIEARNKPKIVVSSKIPNLNSHSQIVGDRFNFGGGN